MNATFTVYFEGPFWVGILESDDEESLIVARHVFGREPTNAELLHFMLYQYADMQRHKGKTGNGGSRGIHVNPKRAQREARREQTRQVSTKAQSALSTAIESQKVEHAIISREERRALDEYRFELRSEKRKRRHAGH
jgi:hypothetical protein